MSQTKRPEIGYFFRHNPRPLVPQKRTKPEPDNDDLIDRTPNTVRFSNRPFDRTSSAVSVRSNVSPLVTPKSGRSVSIPIRSPGGATPNANPKTPTPFFNLSHKDSQLLNDTKTSFSFPDAPSSSKKVVEDGKVVAVRDSDESDNESLESLTDILGRRPENVPASSTSNPPSSSKRQEDERIRLLSMYTGGRSIPIVNREKMRALQRLEIENRFDMSSVLEDDRKEEEARARLAKIEAELEESTREIQQAKQLDMDRKMLASILQGDAGDADSEELGRLMNAVDRTEALSGERSFNFFERGGPKELAKLNRTKRPFPASAIPDKLWRAKDNTTRDQTYLSGIMADLASRGRILDTALLWTFESIPYETNEELREAYLQCIRAASTNWTRTSVTPEDVQGMFVALGAEQSVIRDNSIVESRRGLKMKSKPPDFEALLVTLSIFEAVCQDMDFPTLSKLTSLVCRLCLDDQIIGHSRAAHTTESLLQNLTDLSDASSRRHVHERILSDLGTNLQDIILQARFIVRFVPTSLSTAQLRTRLATKFLFSSNGTSKALESQSDKEKLKFLNGHIRESPAFRITSGQDFQEITASVQLLDAAISSGHHSTFDSHADERDYNEQVDALADSIHEMFVSIADTGASHMRRTEAKDALQSLHNRLLFAVRSKTRRKKHVFDPEYGKSQKGRIKKAEDVRQEKGGRDLMHKFLKKQRAVVD